MALRSMLARVRFESDSRLARRAARGDEAAFAVIFERFHQEIYRYCRAILDNPDEAEDALQNTMARALRALPGESREIALKPWLYRVAHNESISIIRARKHTAEVASDPTPFHPGADLEFESKERLQALVEDLGALPDRLRGALVMRELSGLSHEQIALALSVSVGAAKQAVYEARVALQALEQGRKMPCSDIRVAISDGDGRVLRGRAVRAHLRSCVECSEFRTAITARRDEFQLVAPPLSAVAAIGLLKGLMGGNVAKVGVGGAALAAGGATGMSVGVKAMGVVLAGGALGIGLNADGQVGKDARTAATAEAPAAVEDADLAGERLSEAGVVGKSKQRGHSISADRPGLRAKRGNGRAGGRARPEHPSSRGGKGGATSRSAGGTPPATPKPGTGRPASAPGSVVAESRSGGRASSPTPGKPSAGHGPPAHASSGLSGKAPK